MPAAVLAALRRALGAMRAGGAARICGIRSTSSAHVWYSASCAKTYRVRNCLESNDVLPGLRLTKAANPKSEEPLDRLCERNGLPCELKKTSVTGVDVVGRRRQDEIERLTSLPDQKQSLVRGLAAPDPLYVIRHRLFFQTMHQFKQGQLFFMKSASVAPRFGSTLQEGDGLRF